MIWDTEEHRVVNVTDAAELHVTVIATVQDKEVVELIEELQSGIDILLRDYQRRVTELRDQRATKQQLAFYKVMDDIMKIGRPEDRVVGVDYADNNSPDRTVFSVVRAEKEDGESSPAS